jgi:hypothetical protein
MKSFKPHVLPTLCLTLPLLLACATASAQTVYRCGNSYSQTPCANGRTVQVEDPRSEDQRVAAREGLVRDKALAKEVEAERRRDEAHALALDKAALARAAAAHKERDKQPVAGKKAVGAKAPKTRQAKAAAAGEAAFFTATDGAATGAKKSSSKKKTAGKPAKP